MTPRGRGMAPPQQKAGQGEEHGDREVEPAEQPAADPAGVAGLERDVGDHHADRGTGPHPFDGGQEVPRLAPPTPKDSVTSTSVPGGSVGTENG